MGIRLIVETDVARLLRFRMFQRKHHIAFAVIAIIAVLGMIFYSLSDDFGLVPSQQGKQETAAP